MAYEQILYEVKDHILTLTLNRPDKLNALTPHMRNELIDAFDRADADDQVRAVIVTGAGRAFCAGADLGSGTETFDYKSRDGQMQVEEHRDGGGQLTLRIFESIKPVIAAINGPAVGIGVTMTLAMDIRIAAQNAKIGFVFTRRGIVPEACSSWFLPESSVSARLWSGYCQAAFSRWMRLWPAGSSEAVMPLINCCLQPGTWPLK